MTALIYHKQLNWKLIQIYIANKLLYNDWLIYYSSMTWNAWPVHCFFNAATKKIIKPTAVSWSWPCRVGRGHSWQRVGAPKPLFWTRPPQTRVLQQPSWTCAPRQVHRPPATRPQRLQDVLQDEKTEAYKNITNNTVISLFVCYKIDITKK